VLVKPPKASILGEHEDGDVGLVERVAHPLSPGALELELAAQFRDLGQQSVALFEQVLLFVLWHAMFYI
jgi:hypothetical protein